MTARELWDHANVWAPRVLLSVSAGVLIVCTACYALRPAACAAVTIFPAGCWALGGLLLCVQGRRVSRRRLPIAIAVAWLGFLFCFAEEPLSLARVLLCGDGGWEEARGLGRAVRVVTLNCARRDEAAAEVASLQPDIVLLQESPDPDAVKALAQRLYGDAGGYLAGVDASILARGRVEAVPRESQRPFVHARATLPDGAVWTVISLRLDPPPVEIALWSPATWTLYREEQESRCSQMKEVLAALRATSQDGRIVVGGDFNSPAGDAAPASLAPLLHDAFRDGGRGWPNTITNDFPFARIDQVWIDAGVRAARVEARSTVNSDHRMVVADLVGR